MKFTLIFFILFWFTLGCSDTRSITDRVSGHILSQLSKQMRKKGLIAIGSGGGCTLDKKINDISMTFEHKKIMNISESRELLIEAVQTLLNLINVNSDNEKYFERFPAPVDIIHISIFGESCPQELNCVDVVKIIKGTIYYKINHPLPHVAPYLTLREESFEEAQMIVASKVTYEEASP